MIIFNNKTYQTRASKPNSDWTGEALYVVSDGSELAKKISNLYPYYDFVLDADGNLIDVVETERPEPAPAPEPEPTQEERISALEFAVEMLCMEDAEVIE